MVIRGDLLKANKVNYELAKERQNKLTILSLSSYFTLIELGCEINGKSRV